MEERAASWPWGNKNRTLKTGTVGTKIEVTNYCLHDHTWTWKSFSGGKCHLLPSHLNVTCKPKKATLKLKGTESPRDCCLAVTVLTVMIFSSWNMNIFIHFRFRGKRVMVSQSHPWACQRTGCQVHGLLGLTARGPRGGTVGQSRGWAGTLRVSGVLRVGKRLQGACPGSLQPPPATSSNLAAQFSAVCSRSAMRSFCVQSDGQRQTFYAVLKAKNQITSRKMPTVELGSCSVSGRRMCSQSYSSISCLVFPAHLRTLMS